MVDIHIVALKIRNVGDISIKNKSDKKEQKFKLNIIGFQFFSFEDFS